LVVGDRHDAAGERMLAGFVGKVKMGGNLQ
jgi:hypothetical protein